MLSMLDKFRLGNNSMAGDEESRPVPDPTELTRAAVKESAEFAKSYTDGQIAVLTERLTGIDRATVVLNESINRVPTDVQREIAHVRELMAADREASGVQFRGIESWRKEQKADTKAAVDAALAAAKEAVREQTLASQLATNKSETSFADQLKQQNVTVNTANAGLNRELVDLKERVGKIENLRQGGSDQMARIYAAIFASAALVTLILFFTRNN